MTICELIDILKGQDPTMTVTAERGDYSGHGAVGKPWVYRTMDGTLHIMAEDECDPCDVREWVHR